MATTLAQPLASFSLALWGCLGDSPQASEGCISRQCPTAAQPTVLSCLLSSPFLPPLAFLLPSFLCSLSCSVLPSFLSSTPHTVPASFPLLPHLCVCLLVYFCLSVCVLSSLTFPETSDSIFKQDSKCPWQPAGWAEGKKVKLFLDNAAPFSGARSRDLRVTVSRHWSSGNLAACSNPVI